MIRGQGNHAGRCLGSTFAVGNSSSAAAERVPRERGNGTLDPGARGSMSGQSLTRIDDTALVREAQRGNGAAFEELVRCYDQAVLRLALHLTGSEQEAQDIYQEAFLKAYRNLGSFRFECSFYTWIYRIVSNLCLDHLRKKQVRKEDAPVAVDEEGRSCDVLEQVPDVRAAADPERDLMSRELAARIRARPRPTVSARAHGVRVKALSRPEAADRGRNSAHDRRNRQEYIVPCHAKITGRLGGHAISGKAAQASPLSAVRPSAAGVFWGKSYEV